MKSNLDLVEDTDSFPYPDQDHEAYNQLQQSLWTFTWTDEHGDFPIGYILDRVVEELRSVPTSIVGPIELNEAKKTIRMFDYPSEAARSEKAAALAKYWRNGLTFNVLKTWRDELWPIYGRNRQILFSMERAAVSLLGAMRYGVHMLAFVRDAAVPYGIKIWTPRRSASKSTYPGMLDNTAAGGLMTGEDPFECIIREADEEASLEETVVRGLAKSVGKITYLYISEAKHTGEEGLIYPECEWVYELELPIDVVPNPKDGEAEDFRLFDVNQIMEDLAEGKYKHNCSLVVLDFFIRHGILTQANEPQLAEIQRRMQRELPFPGPHQESD